MKEKVGTKDQISFVLNGKPVGQEADQNRQALEQTIGDYIRMVMESEQAKDPPQQDK